MKSWLARTFDLSGTTQWYRNGIDTWYREKPRFLYFHVPKCGGTSLSHLLRIQYCLSFFKLDDDAFLRSARQHTFLQAMQAKQSILLYHLELNRHFIQGHAWYDEVFDRYRPDYHFITIVRDPLKRAISHYNAYRQNYARDGRSGLPLTFEEYTNDTQHWVNLKVLTHYFSSTGQIQEEGTEELAQRAIQNLKKFSVVGILEHPESITQQFRQACGLKIDLPHRNTTAKTPATSFEPPEEVKEQLRKKLRHEYTIYNYFKDRHCSATRTEN